MNGTPVGSPAVRAFIELGSRTSPWWGTSTRGAVSTAWAPPWSSIRAPCVTGATSWSTTTARGSRPSCAPGGDAHGRAVSRHARGSRLDRRAGDGAHARALAATLPGPAAEGAAPGLRRRVPVDRLLPRRPEARVDRERASRELRRALPRRVRPALAPPLARSGGGRARPLRRGARAGRSQDRRPGRLRWRRPDGVHLAAHGARHPRPVLAGSRFPGRGARRLPDRSRRPARRHPLPGGAPDPRRAVDRRRARMVPADVPRRGAGAEAAEPRRVRGFPDAAPGRVHARAGRDDARRRGLPSPDDRRRPARRLSRSARSRRHPSRPRRRKCAGRARRRHAPPPGRRAPDLMPLGAVMLDAAGTLFEVAEPVGTTDARLAARHGITLAPAEVERGFRTALAAAPPLAFPGGSPARLADHERAWWYAVVRRTFGAAGMSSHFDACFAELFDFYARAAAWRVFADAPEALRALRARGPRVGVVSNFDTRLVGLLDQLGLAPLVDRIVHSTRAGVAKPDPAIFHLALEALGVPPAEALHAGNEVVADVEGARAAGLGAVLVDREERLVPLPPGVPRVRTLAALVVPLDSSASPIR